MSAHSARQGAQRGAARPAARVAPWAVGWRVRVAGRAENAAALSRTGDAKILRESAIRELHLEMAIEPGTAVSLSTKVLGFVREILRLFKFRKGSIVIQPETQLELGKHALFWSAGKHGNQEGMQIVGDFYVTNTTGDARILTGATLNVSYRTALVIPRRRQFLGA